ncbi:hypothetical protein ACFWPH_02130 [Nocardia sp. NPDC058499]|uniref:hypothetical protein n=1 Tax=Nocardia sp. NPDC058499 TaxID=3346530 RepID=UPI0036617889
MVVRFEPATKGTVFVGGLPIEALPNNEAGLQHASVTCCIAPDRDDEYRAELAAEISDALGTSDSSAFLYIEFRPTPLDHVHFSVGGHLQRADAEF